MLGWWEEITEQIDEQLKNGLEWPLSVDLAQMGVESAEMEITQQEFEIAKQARIYHYS